MSPASLFNLSLLKRAFCVIALFSLWLGLEQTASASCGDWLANHSAGHTQQGQVETASGDKTRKEVPPAHRPCNGPKCSQGQLPAAPQSPVVRLQAPDEITALALVAGLSPQAGNDWIAAAELLVSAGSGIRLERPPRC